MRRGRVPPLEVRLRALGGLTPLEPGEVTSQGRFRSNPAVVEAFLSLDTRRRGEVIAAGLGVLGLLEVKDATTDEQTP